jgi:hypothetical protein
MHHLVEESRDPLERADAQQAHDAHLAFCQLAGETKGSIEGTAQILLSAYRSPTVVRSADGTGITGKRLLEGPNTVYLISDSRRSKLLRPILIALLTELLDQAYETANRSSGRRLASPLLVALTSWEMRSRYRTSPRSLPPPPPTTSSSSRSSMTSRRPEPGTATRR